MKLESNLLLPAFCMHMHAYVSVMHKFPQTFMRVNVHIHACTCLHTSECVCMYIFTQMDLYVCMMNKHTWNEYIHAYMPIHTYMQM